MTLREIIQFIRWMRKNARRPLDHADGYVTCICTSNIAIYYYLAQRRILILPFHRG